MDVPGGRGPTTWQRDVARQAAGRSGERCRLELVGKAADEEPWLHSSTPEHGQSHSGQNQLERGIAFRRCESDTRSLGGADRATGCVFDKRSGTANTPDSRLESYVQRSHEQSSAANRSGSGRFGSVSGPAVGEPYRRTAAK